MLPHFAVNVYVVVVVGETLAEPGVATPPMSGSISTESAFVTAPQFSVVELPLLIVVFAAEKKVIFGVPLHGTGVRFTVTVTLAVLMFDPHFAVSVYVVVIAGVTVREPGVSTPPML